MYVLARQGYIPPALTALCLLLLRGVLCRAVLRQAAADSPFLDRLLSSASGVLCVLSLPERVMCHGLDMSTGALNDPEKYAIRAAVQVRGRVCTPCVNQHTVKRSHDNVDRQTRQSQEVPVYAP